MTLDEVRIEARVSNSQIYHYFADRKSLLLAVIDADDREPRGRSPMAGNFISMDAMRAWCRELVDKHRGAMLDNICPILGTEVTDDELHDHAVDRLRRLERDIGEGYLAMLQRGELDIGVDTDNLASVTLATLLGGLMLSRLHQDLGPLVSAVDAVLDRLNDLAGQRHCVAHDFRDGSGDSGCAEPSRLVLPAALHPDNRPEQVLLQAPELH